MGIGLRDILFISTNDWANVGAGFAAAGRKVGMDCLSVANCHHELNYFEKSVIWKNVADVKGSLYIGLQGLADQFKVIVMMHAVLTPIEKRDWQKWAVFHGGGAFRQDPKKACNTFNKVVDMTFLQHGEFFGLGCYNEKWLIPPIDTEYIKPVFSDSKTIGEIGLTFGHYPRGGAKGTEIINKIMEKFKGRCNYRWEAGNEVPWIENLKRMSDSGDVYIESFLGSLGEWGGITVMEAAGLGKIVVTQARTFDKYEQEYNCTCPIVVANTPSALNEQIERLLSFSPETIVELQKKSRGWVETIHGYIPTGLRLKRFLEL